MTKISQIKKQTVSGNEYNYVVRYEVIIETQELMSQDDYKKVTDALFIIEEVIDSYFTGDTKIEIHD